MFRHLPMLPKQIIIQSVSLKLLQMKNFLVLFNLKSEHLFEKLHVFLEVFNKNNLAVLLSGNEKNQLLGNGNLCQVKLRSTPTKVFFYSDSNMNYPKESDARRFDIYVRTDETLRKWNDFFLILNMEQGTHLLKLIDEHSTSCLYSGDKVHFLPAVHAWKTGHISKSYSMFIEKYKEGSVDCQEDALIIVQCLIFHTISTKGKALRSSVIDGARTFFKETSEIGVMVTVWFCLFVSEWHEDRLSSKSLVHANPKLRTTLEKMFPLLSYYFLKSGNLSDYHRLIELSLEFNAEKSTSFLLRALFDYYYKEQYVRGCDAVYKCCSDLGIKLSDNQMLNYNSMKKFSNFKQKYFLIFLPDDLKYKF